MKKCILLILVISLSGLITAAFADPSPVPPTVSNSVAASQNDEPECTKENGKPGLKDVQEMIIDPATGKLVPKDSVKAQ